MNFLKYKKNDNLKALLKSFSSELADGINDFEFEFQQDTVDDLAANKNARIPTEDMIDLASVVCAGTCYWSALNVLGLEKRSLTEFIDEMYDPNNGIKHTMGVDHIKFIKYLGRTLGGGFYGLSLNPYRDQNYKKFKDYGGYFGDQSLKFFKNKLLGVSKTSDAVTEILRSGGVAVVSIQEDFNRYSPSFHDILILGMREKPEGGVEYLFFDPDARVYFDTEKSRPEAVLPVKGKRGFYIVSEEHLDKNTFRKKPSPGGITIGLFSDLT